MPEIDSRPAPTRGMTAGWAALGALGCASVMMLEPNILEEGMVVETARRIASGEHLYRDVLAFTGPVPFELLGALFRIFGEHIVIARGIAALMHGAATASVFFLAREARTGPLAHVAAALFALAPILLFPLLSVFFYTTVSFTLSLVATAAALAGLRSSRWAFAAGALLAGVALCKQTGALVLAPALTIALLFFGGTQRRLRPVATFIAGGLGVTVLTVGVYGLRGDLAALVDALVWLPLRFESSFSLPYMNFWPPGVFSEGVDASKLFYMPYFYTLLHGIWDPPERGMILLTQGLYALPMLAIGLMPLRQWVRPLSPSTWFHFAALLALMTNVVPRTDWGHLVFVLPSACVQLLLLLSDSTATAWHSPNAARASRIRLALAATVALLAVVGSVASLRVLYRMAGPPTFGPKVPFRPVSEGLRDKTVPRAIAYLREHLDPGDPLFIPRSEPLLYFATETRNPTPYPGVIPGMREEQSRVIVDALRRLRFVLMSEIDQPVHLYYRDELPVVQDFLERNFEVPADYLGNGPPPWLVVLEKREDRGEAAFDFVQLQGQGRPFVRGARDPGVSVTPSEQFEGRLATRLNRRFLAFELGRYGGGVDFDLTIPSGAVFQGDIGYSECATPTKVFKHPDGARLRVSVAREADPEVFRPILETRRQRYPANRPRRWTPIEADLSAYAGERVVLRLELVSDAPLSEARLGWFGSPRIAAGARAARRGASGRELATPARSQGDPARAALAARRPPGGGLE